MIEEYAECSTAEMIGWNIFAESNFPQLKYTFTDKSTLTLSFFSIDEDFCTVQGKWYQIRIFRSEDGKSWFINGTDGFEYEKINDIAKW